MMTENSCNPEAYPFTQSSIDLRDRPSPDILRVLAIGSPAVVNAFVITQFQLGSCLDRRSGRDNCPRSIQVKWCES
jgi:hypothetical protein